MPVIQDGVYVVTRPHDMAATVFVPDDSSDRRTQIYLYQVMAGKEQKWRVKNHSNGNVTMQNEATGKYLGFPREPHRNELCEQTTTAVEWHLQQSAEANKYHVVVPGGPVHGTEFALDISPLMIWPPLLALGELRVMDVGQTWGFYKPEK